MSWIAKEPMRKTKKPSICKQSKLPKIPKNYNQSKPIPGNHEVEFVRASLV